MSNLLILGGTGIIGRAVANIAVSAGFDVTCTGIDKDAANQEGITIITPTTLESLSHTFWDCVIDVYNFGKNHAEEVHSAFKGSCGHLFVISTTLVYDRKGYSFERIKSDHPRAKLGVQGGYVDHKISIEQFWESITDLNWTILRPYHIIGKGSYLGCIPPHNRDPCIIEKIRNGEIDLCDGGRIPLNVIHAEDIGDAILSGLGKKEVFKKSYNLVNPTEIIARDYYMQIAEVIGSDLRIINCPGEKIWKDGDWKLTTLPHLYDISDLVHDFNYVPIRSLKECIHDALTSSVNSIDSETTEVYKRMHMLPDPMVHKHFE